MFFDSKNKQNDGYYKNEVQKNYYDKQYPKLIKDMKTTLRREKIKKFRIDRQIGEGSFGRVYLGFDETNGLPVAIKQVPISSFGSDSKL